jgi:hypothetical protein
MLSIIILSVTMLGVIMLKVAILSVIMLNVIMLSVVAPFFNYKNKLVNRSTEKVNIIFLNTVNIIWDL